ncbi:Tim44 domain-containing protein [Terrarubrum flagellatum]|uniref:Tim44 domain-containing protein n=1 Tax=Terrirubrum flagellatum TaxID=2895980 RepID=UPI0031452492
MFTLLSRSRRLVALTLLVGGMGLAAMQAADARVGGGSSSGSRGSRTFSAPSATSTAPSSAQPMQRTVTQPGGQVGQPSMAARPAAPQPAAPSFGRTLMHGVFAGLIGAGIFGLLSGSGFFSGLGSLTGLFGFLLQIGLLVLAFVVIRRMFFNRGAQPAMAGMAPQMGSQPQPNAYARAAMGPAGGSQPNIEITSQDYDAFQRALTVIQTAYGREDVATLRMQATPEMAAYFEQDLADNRAKGVLNRIGDVTLIKGDLSEAWQEPDAQYATVAMRYSIVDATVERGTGRVVSGDLNRPQEVTELWTFRRGPREAWKLSAIQQTN